MDENKLKNKICEIEIPTEMQERILKNCYMKMEDKTMSKNTAKNFFRKPMVAVASLALCVCLTGVTALAATGKLEGFFKDITSWNGAVVGTSYEQATDEIEVSVVSVTDELTIEATMVEPKEAPYSVLETLGVNSYKITDVTGKVIVKGGTSEAVEIANGQVSLSIPLEDVADGEYKLIVNSFVGGAKADQPLVISGNWECTFTK